MKEPTVGDKVICNGYPGTITKVCDGQLTGMVEVWLERGVVCVPYAKPDCYPLSEADTADFKLTRSQAARLVQQQLNTMTHEQLGECLAEADKLRRHGESLFVRNVGELMYQQVLAALTYKAGQEHGEMDGVL